MRKGTIARSLAFFLIGLCCGACLLRLLVLHPLDLYAPERSEKLLMLQNSRYQFSSAAFGSSHVHLGFDPRLFDQTLASASNVGRSVNLGLNGGAQVEQRVMALNFLQHFHPVAQAPCLVLLEVNAPPDFALAETASARSVNIYDRNAWQLALSFKAPGDTRLFELHTRLASLQAWLEHTFNVGMLSNKLFRPPTMNNRLEQETADGRRGFLSEDAYTWGQQKVDLMFKMRPPSPTALPIQLEAGHRKLIEELHAAPHGPEVQFVWFVTPSLENFWVKPLYPESQPTSFGDVPIINLARPDLYPDLYHREIWIDNQHVNEQGAQQLTADLAQQVIQLMKENRIQRTCGR